MRCPFMMSLALIGGAACTGRAQQPAALALHPDSTVAYVAGATAEQQLQLFLPGKGTMPFSTVVFTYGGGWHAPMGPGVGAVCEAFRSRGYACALVAHRLAPADPYPAAESDEAAAVGWVLDHIANLGGDPRRVALVGHSSGAHLALLIASDSSWLHRVHHRPTEIAAVVGLSTPTDLTPALDGRGFGDALLSGAGAAAFSRDTATMRRASPVSFANRRGPPVLLIVGSADFPMLERDARAFAVARERSGGGVEVLVGAGLDHLRTVGALVSAPNPVQSRIFAFLAASLGPQDRPVR